MALTLPNNRRRQPPLNNRIYWERMAVLEAITDAFMEHHSTSGKMQLVSLGAGLSASLLARCRDQKWGRQLHAALDVDTAAVVAQKRELLAALQSAGGDSVLRAAPRLGSSSVPHTHDLNMSNEAPPPLLARATPASQALPRSYRLAAADLRDAAALSAAVAAARLDAALPTLVVAECVLCYLAPQHVTALIAWAAAAFPRCAIALHEAAPPRSAGGGGGGAYAHALAAAFDARRVPLRSAPAQLLLAAAAARGAAFPHVSAVDAGAAAARWLPRAARARAAALEPFDEHASLAAAHAHYAVAVACRQAAEFAALTAGAPLPLPPPLGSAHAACSSCASCGGGEASEPVGCDRHQIARSAHGGSGGIDASCGGTVSGGSSSSSNGQRHEWWLRMSDCVAALEARAAALESHLRKRQRTEPVSGCHLGTAAAAAAPAYHLELLSEQTLQRDLPAVRALFAQGLSALSDTYPQVQRYVKAVLAGDLSGAPGSLVTRAAAAAAAAAVAVGADGTAAAAAGAGSGGGSCCGGGARWWLAVTDSSTAGDGAPRQIIGCAAISAQAPPAAARCANDGGADGDGAASSGAAAAAAATAELRHMSVAVAWRGRSVGAALLRACEATARAELVCARVALTTLAPMAVARALYAARGYRPVRRSRMGAGLTAYEYVQELVAADGSSVASP
ncbi:S-adenosyl-L-methionine-dependent methyltransferase [Tribonema minus]|uniref:[phosphatase 2A protein]-leucine-carboxy methyltransferase n=1 Tax=Tribonema minus TaxID=303371 RepID=A0A835ZGQ9_9STRA|nr:S-adenosyl-L-methionine-dependent methyltransferase [Tribonema minus]